jgi:hypothetical protein
MTVHRLAANNTAECVSVERHSGWVICVTVRGLTGLVHWVVRVVQGKFKKRVKFLKLKGWKYTVKKGIQKCNKLY